VKPNNKGIKLEFFIVCRGDGTTARVYGKIFINFSLN